eukprot:Skav218429  [mRNA]  locus=scaffold420:236554:238607:- [translate_table: standard]
MAFRFLSLLVLCVAWDPDDVFEEIPPAFNLLQTTTHLHRGSNRNRRELPSSLFPPRNPPVNVTAGICLSNGTKKQAEQPIYELAAQLGQDGFCTYGFAGMWASGCAIMRRLGTAIPYATQFNGYYTAVLNVSWATPFTLQLYDGRSVTIRQHNYPLDDLYCFVNGWYSFPDRAKVVQNYTYLEELSDSWCKHLSTIVPGFDDISFSEFRNESVNDEQFLEDLQKDGATFGRVPKSVVDGMYLHAAAKCRMRGPKGGAVCDIADCAAQGCFTNPQSTELLYTVRGECQSVTN